MEGSSLRVELEHRIGRRRLHWSRHRLAGRKRNVQVHRAEARSQPAVARSDSSRPEGRQRLGEKYCMDKDTREEERNEEKLDFLYPNMFFH